MADDSLKRLLPAALSLLAACGGSSISETDPCAAQSGTCLTLQLRDRRGTLGQIDGVDISLAGPVTRETTLPLSSSASLPIAVAVLLPDAGGTFSITATALRGGAAAGAGTIETVTLAAGQHASQDLPLAAAGPAAALVIVSGNAQAGPAGQVLGAPLAVQAVDGAGTPVSGVGVIWAVTGGGGSLSAASTTTGLDGRAQVTATLGAAPGDNTFSASAAGLAGSPPVFTETANAAGSSVAVTASPGGTSTFGQLVTFTATVSGTVAGVPSGAVTFFDGANSLGAPATLTSGVAKLSISSLAGGAHSITARYSGDANFAAATSSAISLTVAGATLALALGADDPTPVSGQQVTFTVTFNGITAATPQGTIIFIDGASPIAGCESKAVVGSGTTCTTSGLRAGSHSVKASYGGDGNYNAAVSNAVSLTASQASAAVSLASSVNPSVFGQPVTFTAAVSAVAPGSGSPAGTVAFFNGATQLSCAESSQIAAGAVSCTVGDLRVGGGLSITAAYGGDANFKSSTSSALPQVVQRAPVTVSIASDINPSVFGQIITLTAAVTAAAPGAGTPTGTVTFQVSGVDLSGCAGQPISSGAATCAVQNTNPPSAAFNAVYNGDANFASSNTSNILTQDVAKATTAIALASSTNPSLSGQPVTLTATLSVAPPGNGTPSGSVGFFDGGTSIASCAAQTVDNVSKAATCTISSLSVSAHSLTAVYGGDGNFRSSASPAINQTVNKAFTSVQIQGSGTSTFGAQVTFIGSITVSSPGAGSPGGTVTFGADGNGLCGAQQVSFHQAVCSVSNLSPGTHSITAAYNGDANFNGSGATPVIETINKAAPGASIAVSQPLGPGIVHLDATITGAAAAAPTGQISFASDGVLVATIALSPSSPGTSVASVNFTATAGTHTFFASYPGDGNYDATSTSVTSTVSAVPPPGTAAVISGGAADGKVLLFGAGHAFLYDPATSALAPGPRTAVARTAAAATAVGDGEVLLAGGNASGGSLFELCSASSCRAVGTSGAPRCNAAAALAGAGQVLVAGGDDCSGNALSSWVLWTADGVVSSTAANAMGEPRGSLTASPLPDGSVLLAGGRGADLFDLTDLSMTRLSPMLAARAGHTATLLPPGSKACASNGACVFLAGGVSEGPTWEIFDVASRSFGRPAHAAELLDPSRARQAAALLADGRVWIAGGMDGNQSIETSELFDGARFVSGPALQAPRTGAASAWLRPLNSFLLADGWGLPELLAAP